MIGQRERGHAEALHALDEPVEAARAVQKRVIAVVVEVDESSAHTMPRQRKQPGR